jgi:hypothetical protein
VTPRSEMPAQRPSYGNLELGLEVLVGALRILFNDLTILPISSLPPLAHYSIVVIMAALRLGSSAFRTSSLISKPIVQNAAFNGLRCYSTSKTQVQ